MKLSRAIHIILLLAIISIFGKMISYKIETTNENNSYCKISLERKLNISKVMPTDRKSEYERKAYEEYIKCIQE